MLILEQFGLGNQFDPGSTDLIAETLTLDLGEVPPGHADANRDGWRILSGNHLFNTWARVAYRYEAEGTAQAVTATKAEAEARAEVRRLEALAKARHPDRIRLAARPAPASA